MEIGDREGFFLLKYCTAFIIWGIIMAMERQISSNAKGAGHENHRKTVEVNKQYGIKNS